MRRENGHESASIRRKHASVRSLLRYLDDAGLADASAVVGVRLRLGENVRLTSVAPDGDLERLLARLETRAAQSHKSVAFTPAAVERSAARRDHAVVRLLATTGLRVGELCGLELGDLLTGPARVEGPRVLGKGRRERLTPIVCDGDRSAIDAWLAARPALGPACEALFVTTRGGSALTTEGVRRLLRVAATAAGVRTRQK